MPFIEFNFGNTRGLRDLSQEISDLSGGFDALRDEIKKTAKAALAFERESSGVANALERVQTVAAGLRVLGAVTDVVRATAAMYELGAEAERAEAALNALSGGDAAQYIDAIREATQGTTSEMEAALIAVQMFGSGVAQSSEQAAEMARIAAILGGTFQGLNAAEAGAEFSAMLSSMSVDQLDAFGISSAEVRTHIEALQAATPGLSQEMAYMQAVMEVGGERADELSSVLDQQAEGVAGLRSEWQDFKAELGGVVAEVGTPILRLANDFIDARQETIKSHTELRRELAASTTTFEDYRRELAKNNAATSAGRAPLNYLRQEYTNVRLEVAATYEAMREGIPVIHDSTAAGNAWADASAAMRGEMESTQVAREEGLRRIEGEAEAEREAAAAAQEYEAAQREVARTLEEARQQHEGNIGTAGRLLEAYDGYGDALANSEQSGQAFLGLLEDSGALAGVTSGRIDDLYVALGLATEQEIAMAGGMETLTGAIAGGQLDIEAATEAWQDFVASGGDPAIIDQAIEAEEHQQAVIDKLTGTGLEMGNMASAAEDAEDRVVTAADEQALALQNGPLAAVTDIETRLGDIQTTAPEALGAMAAAAEENIGPVENVAGVVGALRDDWKWLMDHPTISLTATVDTPGAAGGTNFVTSGPMLMMVGDNPGGRERVQVTPLSGWGVTRGLPAGGTGAGGGGATPVGRGSTVVINFSPTFPGLVDDAAATRALDTLDRALRHQTGRGFYEMAKAV